METWFSVWSAAAGSRGREVGGGGTHLPYAPTPLLLPARGASMESPTVGPPPRPAKAKKKPAGPRKPPQRGLGVEQLERLRLQEEWKKMAEAEPTPTAELLPHFVKHGNDKGVEMGFPFGGGARQRAGIVSGGLSLARFAAAPAPVGCGGAWGESCFLQRHGVLGAAAGGPLMSAVPAAFPGVVASAPPYDAGAGWYRNAVTESGFLQVGNGALTEFPSSQSLQCSEQCDLCVRKKRVLDEKFGFAEGNGVHREGKSTMNLLGECWRTAASAEEMAVARRTTRASDLKEYVFFPCSSVHGSRGGISEVGSVCDGWLPAGDTPSTSSCPLSGKQLDLSLKLSF